LRPLDEPKLDEARENWHKKEVRHTETTAADELKKELQIPKASVEPEVEPEVEQDVDRPRSARCG